MKNQHNAKFKKKKNARRRGFSEGKKVKSMILNFKREKRDRNI